MAIEKKNKTCHCDKYEEMMEIDDAVQWDVCIVAEESRSYVFVGGQWTLPPEPPEPPEDIDINAEVDEIAQKIVEDIENV